jgi:hypothetical protein
VNRQSTTIGCAIRLPSAADRNFRTAVAVVLPEDVLSGRAAATGFVVLADEVPAMTG